MIDWLFYHAPEWIRTTGLCLRRATLYPAELRAPRGLWRFEMRYGDDTLTRRIPIIAVLIPEISTGKRISRVLSLGLLHEAEDPRADHFSRTPIARHLWQPTRDSRHTCVIGAGRASSLIWPCSEWGLPCRRCYQQTRGSLTPPFHPCLCSHPKVEPSAVCSLLHFPSRYHARPLAGTLPFGARTFLEWAGIAATRDPHSLPWIVK